MFPVDDPLVVPTGGACETVLTFYYPDRPNSQINVPGGFEPREGIFEEMASVARSAFFVTERSWAALGCQLADFKIEFGLDTKGKLLLADVIDNDSWRLLKDGEHLDKQAYRDGLPLNEVRRRYEHVAELSARLVL